MVRTSSTRAARKSPPRFTIGEPGFQRLPAAMPDSSDLRAFAADSMKKDEMKKDAMAKDGMAKDGMKKDEMKKDAMGKGDMMKK